MKILIIEDEKLLQIELEKLLLSYSDIEVVKKIQTVEESISWLDKNSDLIDLIFMDIELADGVCFEIFDSIKVKTAIIFLTAYSEYAIRAFKVNSIDYLLKPINSEDLEFALNKFRESISKIEIDKTYFKDIFKMQESTKINRLLINSGDNYRYISVDKIAFFIAEDKYTTLTTFEGVKFIIDDSLNYLESYLDSDKFYRSSRNSIINIKSIIKASRYFNSRLKLHLNPASDFDIIVSRAKAKSFLNWMGTKC